MTEIEKIAYAKSFIDKLKNGINPLDGTEISAEDIVNNVRVSRCLFYVSEVLGSVIENGGVSNSVKQKKSPKKPFSLSYERLAEFEYSKKPISATVLAKKINSLVRDENMERLSHRHISTWLLNIGMLEFVDVGEKKKRRPTKDGEEIGILLQFWSNSSGVSFPVIFYTEDAQRFIIDNIEAVAATKIQKGKLTLPESSVEQG